MIRVGISYIYGRVLLRYREASERIKKQRQKTTAATSFEITPEEVMRETGVPRWLVRRALRWRERKKLVS